MATKQKNIDSIDLMKLLAALAVVGIHTGLIDYLVDTLKSNVPEIISRMAVPLFFIASSFFLVKHLKKYSDYRAQVKKYLIRICQLYVFWLVLYGYFIIKNTLVGLHKGFNWSHFWVGTINFILSGPRTGVVFWYLNATIFACLFVFWWFYKKPKLGFCIAAIMFALTVWFSAYQPVNLGEIVLSATIFIGPIYFYVGWIAERLYDNHLVLKWIPLIIVTLAIIALTFMELHIVNRHFGHSDQLFIYPFLGLTLFMMTLKIRIKIPYAKFWRNMSTFLYLSNFLVLMSFRSLLDPMLTHNIVRYLTVVGLAIGFYVLTVFLQKSRFFKILRFAY